MTGGWAETARAYNRGVACVRFPAPVATGVGAELEAEVAGVYLRGASVAARATAFAVPELGVALDLGRLSPAVAAQPVVLLSHAHLDHSAALLAYLNLRARFYPEEPPTVYLPEAIRKPFLAALALMPGLESVRKRLDLETVLRGVEDGEEVVLPGGRARAVARDHGVPTLGWVLRRAAGGRAVLAYGADGRAAQLLARPELVDAAVAVVECSFVEANRRVAAVLGGHAHVSDLAELAPRLACQVLVLAHLPVLPREELVLALAPVRDALGEGRELVIWAE